MSDGLAAGLSAAYSATGAAWAQGPERVYDVLAAALVGCSPAPLAGRVVVDVGAGTGAASRAALAAGAARVVAVDAAFGMVRHDARNRPPAAVADAVALPFPDGSFGAAVAAFSLNHLREPWLGLAEMARVTRRGGPLVVASYASDDTHPVKSAVEDALTVRGWAPGAWFEQLRAEVTVLLATETGCREALDRACLAGDVHHLRVPFPDLAAADLVRWRLGMAQHAPFFARLEAAEREAVVAEALDRLGPQPAPLVRSVLVTAAVKP